MKYYTLDNTKRDIKQNNLYDLIYPLLTYKRKPKTINTYVVKKNREMRLDLICYDIYGSSIYIDELMHMNGIIDPYSVKDGDIIKWAPLDELLGYRETYNNLDNVRNELNNDNKSKNLTVLSSSNDFVPVLVDKEKREIKITNKLK